jgi:hypothetical protein
MRLFILSFMVMSTTFAFNLNCEVTNYELLEGEAKYASHSETIKLKISVTSEATAFEQEIGCSSEYLTKPHLSITAFGAEKAQDVTYCETQNFLKFDNKTISYSNFNDHDAPEEVLDLFRVGSEYFGKLLSSWDTKEVLELKCK